MWKLDVITKLVLLPSVFLWIGCADEIPEPFTEADFTREEKVNLPRSDTQERTPIVTKEVISPKDGARMRLIPEGEFRMGSGQRAPDEEPVHTVYLSDFYIDVYEVTNVQYKKFIDATGYRAPLFWEDPRFNAPNQPVIGVSWYQAAAYSQWAGKRLPTEAQWEKAARGGLVRMDYSWGNTLTHDDANYEGTDRRDQWEWTAPVGSFPPNRYGLYDMEGNAEEWCADEYVSDFYEKSPKNNPVAGKLIQFVNNDFTFSAKRRVLRGGSWKDPHPNFLRIANRGSGNPSSTFTFRGFRCVSLR